MGWKPIGHEFKSHFRQNNGVVVMFNRPLSPHLTTYDANLVLLVSVWHRITGILLTIVLICYPLFYKLLYYSFWNSIPFSNIYYLLTNPVVSYYILKPAFFLVSGYHILSGFTHLRDDLSTSSVKSRVVSTVLTTLSILVIIIFILIQNSYC